MLFYKCIKSCVYGGRSYRASRVYKFTTAPTGDGAAYFELFTGEIKTPSAFVVAQGLRGTLYLGRESWNDLRFPIQNVKINPATSKPDFDFVEIELLFDDADTETAVGVGQMDHDYLEESSIFPHVHWIQDASGVVKWQLEYKFWNSGDAEPAGWTTITTEEVAFTYVSGDLGQVSYFPAVDCIGKDLSFNMKFRVSRLGADGADTKVGDAKFIEFDIHYRRDSWGSGEAWAK